MKAVLFAEHGGPEKLHYGDAPDPVAGFGEVVVNLRAASVNAADYKVRLGSSHTAGKLSLPHILGRDFSGVIAAIGPGVTDLKVGDAVFGVTDQGIEGCYAEKLAIKGAIIARKPDDLGHVEAAALGLVSLTALWTIEDTLKVKRGETVLVQGGAGGVAGFGIQLAKHLGARVITTASPGNHDYVRSLGADQVIDYHTQDFVPLMKDCDVVFNTVGGDVLQRSYMALKPGGRIASIAAGQEGMPQSRKDVSSVRANVTRDRAHLERMLELLKQGAVTAPAITRFRLQDAAEAHRISEARHLRGKLVFEIG